MRENVSIPGALAVVLLGAACSFLGSTMTGYFKDTGASAQYRESLRDIKGMRDREVDALNARVLALEARCRP
jgi:hypothetical protein